MTRRDAIDADAYQTPSADERPLAGGYRGVVFDLDGVVYLGEEVVPAAPAALEGVRGLGVRVVFVTNNSYRPPELVTEKLNRLRVKAEAGEVLTSAQATVRMLGGREGLDGVRVMVIGGPGLRQALEGAGARLVDPSAWRDAEVVAVGFDPGLTYERARDATLAIRAGARFVGSNPDTTLPTPEGLWPGAGATLAMLQASTGVRPEVAGKPERALLETAAAAIGDGPYLMVGDRADTDLDGARRLGWATALVLSGVTRLADLPDLAAAPDHLLADVAGLLDPPGPAIRPATPADRDAVDGLLAQAPTWAGESPRQGGRGDLELVAAAGPAVVGAVRVRGDGTLGRLDGPVVEQDRRGRLVGTRLLVAACIEARHAGLSRVAGRAGVARPTRVTGRVEVAERGGVVGRGGIAGQVGVAGTTGVEDPIPDAGGTPDTAPAGVHGASGAGAHGANAAETFLVRLGFRPVGAGDPPTAGQAPEDRVLVRDLSPAPAGDAGPGPDPGSGTAQRGS